MYKAAAKLAPIVIVYGVLLLTTLALPEGKWDSREARGGKGRVLPTRLYAKPEAEGVRCLTHFQGVSFGLPTMVTTRRSGLSISSATRRTSWSMTAFIF
jgi:hypothetical protein